MRTLLRDIAHGICFTAIIIVPVVLMLCWYVDMVAGWVYVLYHGQYAYWLPCVVFFGLFMLYAKGHTDNVKRENDRHKVKEWDA